MDYNKLNELYSKLSEYEEGTLDNIITEMDYNKVALGRRVVKVPKVTLSENMLRVMKEVGLKISTISWEYVLVLVASDHAKGGIDAVV